MKTLVKLAISILTINILAGEQADTTMTARTITHDEFKKTFYKDLSGVAFHNILPVRLKIQNNGDSFITFKPNSITVNNASILTLKRLNSLISGNNITTFVMSLIFFPVAFLTQHIAKQLKELVPVIEKHGFNSEEVTVQPHSTFETIVFVHFDLPTKKTDEKTQKFVMPKTRYC